MMLILCFQCCCLLMKRKEKSELMMDVFLCVFLHLSSPFRLSSVSVVFDFNDSHNADAPIPSILLSVDEKRKKKKRMADGRLLCVFFLLSSPLRSSAASVVFDFNDSLNDADPVAPILLPVDTKRKEKKK